MLDYLKIQIAHARLYFFALSPPQVTQAAMTLLPQTLQIKPKVMRSKHKAQSSSQNCSCYGGLKIFKLRYSCEKGKSKFHSLSNSISFMRKIIILVYESDLALKF